MPSNCPFVSIVMPLYNKRVYIERAVCSVLSQTFKKFELLIVNDGSTDGSEQVLEKIKDERICIINQENRGVSAARNEGILRSQYDFIAFLDADDEWEDTFLEKMVKYAYEKEADVVFCNYLDSLLGENAIASKSGKISNYIDFYIDQKAGMHSSSVLLKKKVFKIAGFFPVGIKNGEDVDTWVRIALSGFNVYFLNEQLSIYHTEVLHSASMLELTKKKVTPLNQALIRTCILWLISNYKNDSFYESVRDLYCFFMKHRLFVFLKYALWKSSFQEFRDIFRIFPMKIHFSDYLRIIKNIGCGIVHVCKSGF